MALTLAYLLLTKLSVTYLSLGLHGSLVWLPNGLALAALLVGGRKYWPAVFVGALVGFWWVGQPPGLSLAQLLTGALGSSLGKTVGPYLVVGWLRRVPSFDAALNRAHDYWWLSRLGAAGGLVNATIGGGTLWLAGVNQLPITLAATMLDVWMGDVLGVVLFVPALLVWRRPPSGRVLAGRSVEAAVGLGLAGLTGQVVLAGWQSDWLGNVPLGYLFFAFVLWSAVRFGRHVVVGLIALFAVQGLYGAARGVGYLGHQPPSAIWLFLLILSVVGITVSLLFHAGERAEWALRAANAELVQANEKLQAENAARVVAEADASRLFAAAEQSRETLLSLLEDKEAADAALRASEARWQFALEGAGDDVWDWDVPTSTVFFSKRYKEMLGYTEAEIGTGFEEWSSRVHPEDMPQVMADLQPHLDAQTASYRHEHRVRCKDGSYIWILARGLVITRDAAGKPLRMVGTSADITARKQAELREATYSRTMTALAGGAPLAEVLTTLVRGVEAEHPGTLGSVLLLDAAGTHLLTGAAPSLPAFYNEAIHGVAIGPTVGSCGTAAFTGERVLVADIQTDPLWTDFKALAAQAGLAACWSEPIRGTRGRVVGTFAFYRAQPRLPSEAEIGTIVASAQLAAVAIERTQANETLRRSTQLLEASQAIAKTGGWELDLGTHQLFWTAETYRLHDTSPDEFNPTVDAGVGYYLPESRRIISEALQAAMERGEGYDLVLEILTTKGRRIDVRATCTVTLHEGRPAKLTGIFQDITERAQAQAALRKSEEHLSSLMHSVDGIVWEADAVRFHFTFVSPGAERLLGYPLARWLEEPTFWAEHIHPEDRETAVHLCVSSTQANRDYEFEYRMLAADGRTVWLRDIVTVVSEDGQAVKLRGLMVDITERKRAESERDRLFNFSTDLICVASYQGYFTQVNPAWNRTFGWTEAELTSRPWLEFVHPDDYVVTDNAGKELVDGMAVLRFENRFRHKDGSYRWLQCNSFPLPEAQMIFCIARDITASKQAEAALAQSTRALVEAQRIAGLGIWRLDVASNQVFWTEELYRMYGFDPALPVPPYTEHAKLFTPESWSRLSGAVAHNRETGTPYEIELETVRQDGSRGWILARGERVQDASGATVEIHGVAQDITARKAAEKRDYDQLAELLRWQQVTIGREQRVQALKEEVNRLLSAQGQPTRYTGPRLSAKTAATELDAEGSHE